MFGQGDRFVPSLRETGLPVLDPIVVAYVPAGFTQSSHVETPITNISISSDWCGEGKVDKYSPDILDQLSV
ncbi:hypothetical protein [Devosia sp.]|uniref:hypothetical protein n=1 Tax=Devosia sp. TaxID=1871048 RepID=UPI002735C55E|nr:hypothetical protein [Devosia sp.]MDP2782558.1 hypothetical protein [Devosia sp.]